MYKYSHWLSTEQFDPDDYAGFVYLIKNNLTNKKYIGKKNFRFKNNESNWKRYTGSQRELSKDIKHYGMENFSFAIIHLVEDPDKLILIESQYQTDLNVVSSDEYYNRSISCRALDATGSCRDEQFRLAISNAHKGRAAPNKGIPHTQETKDKIGTSNRGKKRSKEVSEKLSRLRKGIPQTQARITANIKQRNHTKYHWHHDVHGEIYCSVWELAERFNIIPNKIGPVTTKRYRSYHGWSINWDI